MLFRRKIKILIIAIIACISTFASSTAIEWKVQSAQVKGSKAFLLELHLANLIAQKTKNELIITVLPPKGYVPIRSAFNAVRTGKIEGMLTPVSYWSQASPIFAIMGDLVAAWNNPSEYRHWLEHKGGIAHLEGVYNSFGLKQVGYVLLPVESLLSTEPLIDIYDLKGKRIRTPPGMVTDYFKSIGALPRQISVDNILKTLKSGQISATDYSNFYINHDAGLHKVAKHTVYPGFHSMTLSDFVVNQAAWEALSDSQRNAMISAMSEISKILGDTVNKELEDTLLTALDEGVSIYNWSKEKRVQARQLAVPIWRKYAGRSPQAEALVEELIKYLRKIGNL